MAKFLSDKATLTYDDVLLVPQYSSIETRTQVDLSVAFEPNFSLAIPIVSSPMDTITGANMAAMMFRMGGLGIIHRYNSIEKQADLVETAMRKGGFLVGAAVGVTGDYLERTQELVAKGASVICIDVAHGHHKMMKEAISSIKSWAPDYLHIMAGNVATRDGYEALADWGADSVRCNVGGGCFVAGTLVRTAEGDKPIEKVSVGDSVYTHTGNVRKVVDTLSFDRDEEIAVVNGIEATLNHEFYVVDKDKAHLINDENINEIAYWIEAEHLDKSRHLLVEID